MTFRKIETAKAPKPIGPYSQAVGFERLVFISGQIPIEPKSGKILETTIEGQTEQALDNVAAILNADNLNWQHVIKVEIYVKDLNDFQKINPIYAKRFSDLIKPARQLIQAARLPMDSLIEISCIAIRY